MDKKTAAAFIGYMVGRVGGGYHPDNKVEDYIHGQTGKQLFTAEEVATLQPLHDDMCLALGNESYVLGLELFDKVLNI